MIKFRLRIITSILVLFFIISSCTSGKSITYFQNLKALEKEASAAIKAVEIKSNDELVIIVSGENSESVRPYNLTVVSLPGGDVTSVGGQESFQTYLVDNLGNIDFPTLGTIEVAGLTKQELSEKLEKIISKYVQNPIVTVRIANFQVTVLGEVNRPGTFSAEDAYISLPQVLGFAGDLSIYGQRKNILVLREEENGKTSHAYLNLSDANIINSPYYYLEQNDIVYVEPNKSQKQRSGINPNTSTYFSLASILISLAILFTR